MYMYSEFDHEMLLRMISYTLDDSDVVLSIVVNVAMLEVYLLQQCSVLNLRTEVETQGFQITLQ